MKKQPKNNFVVFILTYGRPEKQITTRTLRNQGYTGKIYYLCSDDDSTLPQYKEKYGDDVIVFSKEKYKDQFDIGNNFNNLRGVVYARNANFHIAKEMGIKHFIQLDDDYTNFNLRFDRDLNYKFQSPKNLDVLFQLVMDFFIQSRFTCIALGQGGDYFGGQQGTFSDAIKVKRKVMNSFFCSTDRPFKFHGQINEDTTAYVDGGMRGLLFATINQFALQQVQTQESSGGLTELYLDAGTYVKSFYSVMYQPSCVKVSMMGSVGKRLHHLTDWDRTCPKILSEVHKKVL